MELASVSRHCYRRHCSRVSARGLVACPATSTQSGCRRRGTSLLLRYQPVVGWLDAVEVCMVGLVRLHSSIIKDVVLLPAH